MTLLTIFPVEGIGEIGRGDDLAQIIVERCELRSKDVVAITSKIVSKSEGRVVPLDADDPLAFEKLVVSQSKRILRRRGNLMITETHHGFICANAGIDQSNIEQGYAVLLPNDPDKSARRIRKRISLMAGIDAAVVITDTFGRTWRKGVCDVAIGCAGIAGLVDLRGTKDGRGRILSATEIAAADEIAAAAELAKPKDGNTPVVIVRGLDPRLFRTASISSELVRPYEEDLFR